LISTGTEKSIDVRNQQQTAELYRLFDIILETNTDERSKDEKAINQTTKTINTYNKPIKQLLLFTIINICVYNRFVTVKHIVIQL
jgi:hypothetical protein